MGKGDENVCSIFAKLGRFVWAIFYLFIIVPITAIIYFFEFLVALLRSSWFIFTLLLVGGLGFGVSNYHDTFIEFADYIVRCIINPVADGVVLPIANFLRGLYNEIICYWDATNWFVFGYFNNVLAPGVIACGVEAFIIDIGAVVSRFFDVFVYYIVTGQFLTGTYDGTALSLAMVQAVDDWIALCCCLCQDLCCLVKNIPFILMMFPFPLNIIIPALSPHYEFWQCLESLINLAASILQILWPLLINLLNLSPPQSRPDFERMATFACQFWLHFTAASELAIQRVWDSFLPVRANFIGTLAWSATLNCVIIDSVEVILTVFTNIDIVVFNMFTPWPNSYVGPPYTSPIDLWHGKIKDIIVRIMNTNALITDDRFQYDVHQIGRRTMTEAICILIRAIICDPAGLGTGSCFNSDPLYPIGSGGFLMGFNFCCFTTAVITGVNDGLCGLYDMFLHTTSAADWFLWLDTQKATRIQVDDIVNLASCIFSIVDNVPVVGYCLKQVFVQQVNFGISVVEFVIRVLIALVTLIWDFLNNTRHNNFLLQGDDAIVRWEEIVDILLGQTPGSLLNCMCYVLNYGIQIPPITLDNNGNFMPCMPSCVPVNFIPPPPVLKRLAGTKHLVDWSNGFLDKAFTRSMSSRVTPIMSYNMESTMNHSWFHPNFLKERFLSGAANMYASVELPDVDELIARKTTEFHARRHAIDECQKNDLYKSRLRQDDPWRYKLLFAQNKLPDTSNCIEIGAYDYINPGAAKDKHEQRSIFLSSARRFDVYSSYGLSPLEKRMEREEFWKDSGMNMTTLDKLQFYTHNNPLGEHEEEESERILPPPDPLTTRPTAPPIDGCPMPGEPPNPCFDLCCFARQATQLIGTVFLLVPHLLDGLVRGNFPDESAGEVQWGYLIGAQCDKRCLEKDIMHLIIYALDGLVCLCKLLTLVLPSSPSFPQPDFCCALTRIADLTVNLLQMLINGIKSLALDSPQFIYFNDGYLVRDVNEVFDEMLGISACLCQFLRYIFPISQLTGGTIKDGGGAFDICCIPMTIVDSVIQLLRLIILVIINLATLEGSGKNFWFKTGGQVVVDDIGFIVETDALANTFYGSPGGVCAARDRPQGIGGIASCICQLLALIIPIRDHPGEPISDSNCPIVDLCCPIREVFFILKDLSKFSMRGLASIWQSWNPADNNRCDPGMLQPGQTCESLGIQPYAFLDYVFCNELTPEQISMLPLTPQELLEQRKCGKLLPIIDTFSRIIAICPCQFLSLADAWLATYFEGFDCFCGQVDGVMINLGDLVKAVLVSVFTLLRRIKDLSYWQPYGRPSANNSANQFDQTHTWTFNFFGPIIDAICNVVASVTCFLDILLPFCKELRQRIVKSTVRWILEAILKVGALVEGIIGIFVSGSSCGDPDAHCPTTAGSYGITTAGLADVFTALAAFPADAFLGDSTVVCSTLNPPQCPISNRCCCYNPMMLSGAANFIHITTEPLFPDPDFQCFQCLDSMCTRYADSFAYPTCTLEGAEKVKCFDDGNPGLVSCDAVNRGMTKLDGIVMAFVRYFQCVFGMLLPEFVKIFQGLIIAISVVWQYVNSILRLIAAVVMFLFGILIRTGSGGCSCWGNYHEYLGLCYQCQNLWSSGAPPDRDAYMCKVNVGFTLGWNTNAFPSGTIFTMGQTFPCKGLAYARACLSGGIGTGDTLSPSVPGGGPKVYVEANNDCAEAAYKDWIVTTNAPSSVNPSYIYTADTFYSSGGGAVDPITGSTFITNGDAYQCAGGVGGTGLVSCGVITFVTNFLSIFEALSAVFQQGPVIPEQPTFRSMRSNDVRQESHLATLENRTMFKRRMEHLRTENAKRRELSMREYSLRGHIVNQDPDEKTGADLISDVLHTVWGFSTSDCMEDINTCACRNMHLPQDRCAEATKRKRDTGPRSLPIMGAIADTMDGWTDCDYHIRAHSNTSWDDVYPGDKAYYVDCLEKIVQGGRLNEASPLIPHDFFYRHDGVSMVWDSLRGHAAITLKREHEETVAYNTRRAHNHPHSKERNARQDVHIRALEQRRESAIRYVTTHPRWQKSMIATALIEFDQFEFKLRQGYYTPMLKDAYSNIVTGNLPKISMRDRFGVLGQHVRHVGNNLYGVQLRRAAADIFEGLAEMPNLIKRFQEKSVWQIYWDARAKHDAQPRRKEEIERRTYIRDKTKEAIVASPLYKWWYDTWTPAERAILEPKMPKGYIKVNPLTRLIQHLTHVYNWHRENWERSEPNGFTMDLHMRKELQDYLSSRFRLTWTPEIESNWASVARIFHRVKAGLWPDSVGVEEHARYSIGPNCTIDRSKRMERLRESNASDYMREIQMRNRDFIMDGFGQSQKRDERGFLIGGNCLLMDGFVEEFLFLITYCANDFMPQLPPYKRAQLTTGNDSWLFWRTMEDFAQRGKAMYSTERDYYETPYELQNTPRSKRWVVGEPTPFDSPESWTTWSDWLMWAGKHYVRPKFRAWEDPRIKARSTVWQHFTKQQWLRATASAAFSLSDWIISIIDSIAGTNIAMEIRVIVMNVEDFIENPNEDYMAGPVGLKYWALFPLRCQFQPKPGQLASNAAINLNCKVGIGLERAIGWVTLILGIVFLAGVIFLPPIQALLQLVPLSLLFVVLVPAVAWHYSPRCWLMTPSLLLPGVGSTGISVPYYPLPIAFPALPFCLMDELVALVDKYTGPCWCQIWWGTPLEFFCSPYMVLGDTCPPCPQKIFVYNCADLGFSSGIDNVLYILIKWVPDFGTAIDVIAQTAPLRGQFGETLAQFGDYLSVRVAKFQTDDPIKLQQYDWCFGITILSVATYIVLFIVLMLFVSFVWKTLLLVGGGTYNAVAASPLMYIVPGWTDSDPYEDIAGPSYGQDKTLGPGFIGVQMVNRKLRPRRQAATALFGTSLDRAAGWAGKTIRHLKDE